MAADAQAVQEQIGEERTLLLDQLRRIFSEYRWPFTNADRMPALVSELTGPLGSWTFYAQVVAEQQLVAFDSVCPFPVPRERRADMSALLTNANHGLAFGNFELDMEDGEVRFKTVLAVEADELRPALVKRMVRANGLAMETYLPQLKEVAAQADAAAG